MKSEDCERYGSSEHPRHPCPLTAERHLWTILEHDDTKLTAACLFCCVLVHVMPEEPLSDRGYGMKAMIIPPQWVEGGA